ncbi:MAG: hypothetical protein ACXAB7_15650 [Candidatus Kariarchaeaceae archaeon]
MVFVIFAVYYVIFSYVEGPYAIFVFLAYLIFGSLLVPIVISLMMLFSKLFRSDFIFQIWDNLIFWGVLGFLIAFVLLLYDLPT